MTEDRGADDKEQKAETRTKIAEISKRDMDNTN